MGFWNTTAAAPSWISTWFPPIPGYLRLGTPALPHIPPPYAIVRLGPDDAREIAALWRTHYGGADWRFDADEALVHTYVKDPRVIVLGLRTRESLWATIAAVPLGRTTMSHGATLEELYVVEGLVVHGDLRGQGVAGWMIAAIDGTLCRWTGTPFACLWAREISVIPSFPTFVSCLPYWSTDCRETSKAVADAAAFQSFWDSVKFADPHIKVSRIDGRRGGLRYYQFGEAWVVVSDTRRRTHEGRRIYEIVWASTAAAVAAVRLDGLLFTTMDMTGRQGWTTGRAGYHAYSLYNYRAPAYGNCVIGMIREEL